MMMNSTSGNLRLGTNLSLSAPHQVHVYFSLSLPYIWWLIIIQTVDFLCHENIFDVLMRIFFRANHWSWNQDHIVSEGRSDWVLRGEKNQRSSEAIQSVQWVSHQAVGRGGEGGGGQYFITPWGLSLRCIIREKAIFYVRVFIEKSTLNLVFTCRKAIIFMRCIWPLNFMCHSIAAPGDSVSQKDTGLTGCQQLAPEPTTDRTSDLSHAFTFT